MLYCFGLDYLPVSLVVTLSNLYIVVTIVLGIVVLHEPVTGPKIAGLTCIVAGVLLLGHSPARYAAHPGAGPARTPRQARGFVIMGVYVVLIGVGAFLEKPALTGLTATQLNALMGIAMTAVAGTASPWAKTRATAAAARLPARMSALSWKAPNPRPAGFSTNEATPTSTT